MAAPQQGVARIIYMLTALPGATNDLTSPCHEQRAGAATESPGLTSMLSRVESSSDLQFVVSQSGEVPLQINTIEQ